MFCAWSVRLLHPGSRVLCVGKRFISPEERRLPPPSAAFPWQRCVCLPPSLLPFKVGMCWGRGGSYVACCDPRGRLSVCARSSGRSPLQGGASCPMDGSPAAPVGPSAGPASAKPSSAELWTRFPLPSSEKAELGSQRDRQGSHHPNPDKVTPGPLRLTASGGAGARALAGCVCVHACGFVLKDTILGTPLCSPQGTKSRC